MIHVGFFLSFFFPHELLLLGSCLNTTQYFFIAWVKHWYYCIWTSTRQSVCFHIRRDRLSYLE